MALPDRLLRAGADDGGGRQYRPRLAVPCQVSLESPMACGIGVCFSCVKKIRDPSGGWDYRRTCVEGPVFEAADVEFVIAVIVVVVVIHPAIAWSAIVGLRKIAHASDAGLITI